MKDKVTELLKTVPWFEGLSDHAIMQLSRHARIQRFPAGTVLFMKGDIPDFCYVEFEGSTELFVTGYDLKESLVEISNALNAYTMAAVLTGGPYIVSGRTITPAAILMLEAHALRKFARTHPQLSLNLLGLICWQFRAMVRQVVSLKSKSTAERLGCYLLSLSNSEKDPGRIKLPLDKKRLAGQLGMTPMSLSRAFKTLSLHGIEVQGNTVGITNPNQLRAYSRPDPLIDAAERKIRFLID